MQQRNRGKDLLTLAEKPHYNKTMGDAHRTPEVKKWGDAPRTNNSSQIYPPSPVQRWSVLDSLFINLSIQCKTPTHIILKQHINKSNISTLICSLIEEHLYILSSSNISTKATYLHILYSNNISTKVSSQYINNISIKS